MPPFPERREAVKGAGDEQQARPHVRQVLGATQGQRACQGGTSAPDEAAVRLHQGALPWPGQETTQIYMLFALRNLWMARSRLLPIAG